ncbi:type III effector HopAJ2 [Xenorhabdus stockiae]|uniref:Type III effector HopAJ2 n=1 Tax=Xenorhabdus stockiae TaxID=351614 RepID=A0A2D0KRI5_9GAMM|nr:lytic murein transglycosylase [Xenorhabdus stockiae]PHM65827.1 type III effector HopAJ2 [Xenorhabdus stockiae]
MKLIIKVPLLLSVILLAGCISPDKKIQQDSGLTVLSQVDVKVLEQQFPRASREPSQFPAYVALIRQQARKQGFSEETLKRAFADIHFIPRVIKSDRNQPEKKATLDEYLKRVLPDWKIKQGVEQYQNNSLQLERIGRKYGIPESYIVALWGLESGFGRMQGKEDVISALSTLAFEGRREDFFIKQLLAALEIIEKKYIGAGQTLKGSWAGAMGQSQFMPTSYLTYAADGNGDGKIDIWNSKEDVFASTANYLHKEGWQKGLPWGFAVSLPDNFDNALEGVKAEQGKSISQWQSLGVFAPEFAQLPAKTNGWIIITDGVEPQAFWVTQNFRTIMHWNRSYYFALSVGMMADGIEQRMRHLTH